MDSATEKSCLDEISTIVFDSLQKVTLKTISNNWQVSNATAKDILNKWLSQNEKKLKELVKEFLIQGINSKGMYTISIVSEKSKEQLEKKWKNFSSWLYSIETKSNSKTLDLPPKFEAIQVKNIKINCGNRDLFVPIKQEPTKSNVDTTKIKTPFGMVKPLDKIKKEKQEEETPSKENTKIIDPMKKELPQKVSPETKSTNNAKKNNKNPPSAQGKASISSFFNKPSIKTSAATEKSQNNSTKIKEEPKDEVMKEDTSRKRAASPEKPKQESAKKPASKKPKLKDPSDKKRSRIQVMEDSSEEEEEEPQIEEQSDSKFIKFDREMTPEENIRSPVKEEPAQEVEEEEEAPKKGKNKAKRWVTKRFETDDGFIRTEKVLEEYSASEDENDENRKKNSPSHEKNISPSKKSPQKKITSKTKVKDMPKTKQGSIMNFFSKK